MNTCTVYADALCIVTLSVCCVTGTDNDTVTDIDIDTDTNTYTDTVDNDTDAARKLYFGIILESRVIQLICNSLRVATMTIVICGQVVSALRPGLVRKLDGICSRGD